MQSQKQKYKHVEWINIIDADKSIVDILRKLGVHPLHIEDILDPNRHTKLEQYGDYTFIISQYPVYNRKEQDIESTEIDIIAFRDKLVTIHKNEIPELNAFFWLCKDNKGTQERLFGKGTGILTSMVLSKLLDRCIPMIDHFIADTEGLRQSVFRGDGKILIRRILSIQRNIIEFRRIFSMQSSIIKSLHADTKRFLGTDLTLYYSDMRGKINHMTEILSAHKEAVEVLRQAHDSLMRDKFSNTVKILTVYSLITGPLNIILSAVSWNLSFVDQFANQTLFFSIIGFLVILSTSLAVYLKNKDWY